MELSLPTIADIRASVAILDGLAVRTPLLRSPALTGRCGREVWLKPETLQLTGSFKFRGAAAFVARVPQEDRSRGVVAYSSGNHAQGVAAAAHLAGMPATIVMPADAPATKLARTRAWGADVVTYDRATESREEIAGEIAASTGAMILPPYDHPWTISGQGTVGVEIAADCRGFGVVDPIVLVPASGGGLTAGIALALEADLPGAAVHTVEPAGFDDHVRSFAAGRPVDHAPAADSICDALMSLRPGEITFAINRSRVRGAHAVDDVAVLAAVRAAFEEVRLIVEPGGAVGLAALLEGMVPGDGPVVVVLSGGNLDREMLERALAG